jgi:serine/threonine protein kinase
MRVNRSNIAEIERDPVTGNKMINDYEVLKELGRGEHGKVKLARDCKRDKKVAIKIVQRFSKQRRLARLGQPEEKVKKEIAILKKARHPNVVALLEVIDDPKLQKVYIILEYVPLGEIVWRKLGMKAIVEVEKQRLEREKKGIAETAESMEADQSYIAAAEKRHIELERRRELLVQAKEEMQAKEREKRLKPKRLREPSTDSTAPEPRSWSLEHGGEPEDTDYSATISRTTSGYETPHASANQVVPSASDEFDQSPSAASRSGRDMALAGSMYGPYVPDIYDDRRSSVASSLISQNSDGWNAIDEEYSYVPCLTLSEIRAAFRDTVLGLEYLHYQGIIHRDLKPANLLWTADRRTKISDFGVSYLGRPIRDDDKNDEAAEENATELHDPKELSRTVGTPAFYAPELCITDQTIEEAPKVTGQIDVWALGVTLYCMLFGRVPFYDENDWAMYQKIVKDDVFIPRKRLKAVEDPPPTPPTSSPQLPRSMNSNKRLPFELVYEPIEDELVDLLKRLFTKDPSARISLKEVKRHPWVLGEIPDQIAWVDETDPSRQSAGKKIEVSDQDVAAAVSKASIVERVRSTIGRIGASLGIGGGSRRRAPSAATSVATEPSTSTSSTSTLGKGGESKLSNLHGDEAIFNALKASREGEHHPLSQSVSASPELKEGSSYFLASPVVNAHPACTGATPAFAEAKGLRPSPPERTISTAESIKTVKAPGSNLSSSLVPPPNTPEPNATMLDSLSSGFGGLLGGAGRRITKSMRSRDRRGPSSERSSSVDRQSVHEDDPHGEPSIAVSTAFASGQVNPPAALQEESPSSASPERRSRFSSISSHPRSPQYPYDSTPEAFNQAQEQLMRRQVLEEEAKKAASRPQSAASSQEECPPSPDDDIFYRQEQELLRRRQQQAQEAQESTMQTSPPSAATISSSSDDQFTSGMSQSTSHPSIPSVVSGASSLSADDYLLMHDQQQIKSAPTTIPPMMRTDDTVTPAMKVVVGKVDEDEAGWNGDDDDDDDSEDEDEGLTFGKSKAKKPLM